MGAGWDEVPVDPEGPEERVAVFELGSAGPLGFKAEPRFAARREANEVGSQGGLGRAGGGRCVPVVVAGGPLDVDEVEVPGVEG